MECLKCKKDYDTKYITMISAPDTRELKGVVLDMLYSPQSVTACPYCLKELAEFMIRNYEQKG
jgi:hypothetical protein